MKHRTLRTFAALAQATALSAVMLGCREKPPEAASGPEFHLVDLMPRYWAFRDSALAATPDDQVPLFRSQVIGAEPRFFEQVIGLPDDARLARYLSQMVRYDSVMRRIAPEIVAAIPGSVDRFRRLIPGPLPAPRFYVTPSLFNSNGQVRYLDDTLVIMLGPDVQAYVEVEIDSGRPSPPSLTIDHELTHYHHWRRNADVAAAARSFFTPGAYSPLYYNLWSEGMATYVTRQLNPDVPLSRVLGPGLDPVRDDGQVPALAREFLAKLESRSEDDVRDLFYLSGRRTDIPVRSAYYLGYLVIERLAIRSSLDAMMQLQGADLEAAVRSALAELSRRSTP